jgi:hypothetical protein
VLDLLIPICSQVFESRRQYSFVIILFNVNNEATDIYEPSLFLPLMYKVEIIIIIIIIIISSWKN